MKKIFQILKNSINSWKTLFGKSENSLLFISLIVFFPTPFCLVFLIGLSPTLLIPFIGNSMLQLNTSPLFVYIGWFIISLNVLLNCYLLKFIVQFIEKISRKLTNNTLKRKVALGIFVAIFILLSCLSNIYLMGDAGGGSHQYNFITFYKYFLLGIYD